MDIVGTVYGDKEKEVMLNLLSMGHIQIEDLRDAYQAKFKQAAQVSGATNGHTNGNTNDEDEDEDEDDPFADPDEPKVTKPDDNTGLHIRSLQELDEVLAHLIQTELVCCVAESSFRNWDDIRKLEEDKILASDFPGGVRGGKGKEDYDNKVAKRLREVRDEPLRLKGKIAAKTVANKRRKLSGWNTVNSGGADQDDGLILDVSAIPRDLRTLGLTVARVTLFYVSTTTSVLSRFETCDLLTLYLTPTARRPPRCTVHSFSS